MHLYIYFMNDLSTPRLKRKSLRKRQELALARLSPHDLGLPGSAVTWRFKD
jgi:hypothetical protein